MTKTIKTLKSQSKTTIRNKFKELLRLREEAMQDPNNPLYALRSNYYRNNYIALTGLQDELFKLQRFPLFKLVNEVKDTLLKYNHEQYDDP